MAAVATVCLALALALATGLAHGAQGDASAADGAPPSRADRIEEQLRDEGTALTDLSPPPHVSARGWLIYDATDDEAIAGVEATTPRPIASLAKLMTARVVVDRVDLGSTITIPRAVNDLAADAARMDLRPGERWKARDLLRAMLVYSANDAAIALSEQVTDGDDAAFVKLMNEQADELGLDDTEFASATGLDRPGTLSTSTPVDLVELARTDLEQPDIAKAIAEPKITLQRPGGGAPIVLTNRNPLLGKYPGIDGVKTGFTDPAGYMLVTHHVDAVTGGELFVATFHSSSTATRSSDTRALLDWARPLRSDLLAVEGGTPLGSIPVQHSDAHVRIFACDDLHVTARVQQHLDVEVVVPRSLSAPVTEGDEVGQVRVRVDTAAGRRDDTRPSVPVCAGNSVVRRSRGERLRDRAGDYRHAWRTGVDGVEDGWSSLKERVS
ncbi:MAG: D-alanyl-D-alanine carboxypeptidase [Thermoleophilia bacterium]|nr:D-alanyl-D-alanine carboxypeptidase [Thermoleophilia bacterium]